MKLRRVQPRCFLPLPKPSLAHCLQASDLAAGFDVTHVQQRRLERGKALEAFGVGSGAG